VVETASNSSTSTRLSSRAVFARSPHFLGAVASKRASKLHSECDREEIENKTNANANNRRERNVSGEKPGAGRGRSCEPVSRIDSAGCDDAPAPIALWLWPRDKAVSRSTSQLTGQLLDNLIAGIPKCSLYLPLSNSQHQHAFPPPTVPTPHAVSSWVIDDVGPTGDPPTF